MIFYLNKKKFINNDQSRIDYNSSYQLISIIIRNFPLLIAVIYHRNVASPAHYKTVYALEGREGQNTLPIVKYILKF